MLAFSFRAMQHILASLKRVHNPITIVIQDRKSVLNSILLLIYHRWAQEDTGVFKVRGTCDSAAACPLFYNVHVFFVRYLLRWIKTNWIRCRFMPFAFSNFPPLPSGERMQWRTWQWSPSPSTQCNSTIRWDCTDHGQAISFLSGTHRLSTEPLQLNVCSSFSDCVTEMSLFLGDGQMPVSWACSLVSR